MLYALTVNHLGTNKRTSPLSSEYQQSNVILAIRHQGELKRKLITSY